MTQASKIVQDRRAFPCHNRGTAIFATEKYNKNRGVQVADTHQLPKLAFWQLKQCLALFAALLRGVWKKTEPCQGDMADLATLPD